MCCLFVCLLSKSLVFFREGCLCLPVQCVPACRFQSFLCLLLWYHTTNMP